MIGNDDSFRATHHHHDSQQVRRAHTHEEMAMLHAGGRALLRRPASGLLHQPQKRTFIY